MRRRAAGFSGTSYERYCLSRLPHRGSVREMSVSPFVVGFPGVLAVLQRADECLQEAVMVDASARTVGAQGGRRVLDAVENPGGAIHLGQPRRQRRQVDAQRG